MAAKQVMFYTPSLNIGGIERVFITYANALCDHYNVIYVYGHDGGELLSLLDLRVVSCSLGNLRLRKSLKIFINVINKYDPDVLITGGDIPNCFCIISSFLSKRTPQVIISHHNYFNVERNSVVSKLLMRYVYNCANKVIAVSNGIADFLLKNGVRKEKIATIYNPINYGQIIEKSGDIFQSIQGDYCISVGRLGAVKNIPLMIDSFSIVLQKYPNLKLVIVGGGELESELKKYINAKNLDNQILILGALSNPYPLMKNSKLVLLSSLSEALPTVILEAFALGKTVVSTPTVGSVDLLKCGEFGYISNSLTSAEDLAETICAAYEKPINPIKLCAFAQRFSIETKVHELECLWLD